MIMYFTVVSLRPAPGSGRRLLVGADDPYPDILAQEILSLSRPGGMSLGGGS